MNADSNGTIASLLRDLAMVQESLQSRRGYLRAAEAVFGLDEPVGSLLLPGGGLRKIPNVGPKSERVILEVLSDGDSPTVADAVRASAMASDVEASRALRSGFLSRAQALTVLADVALTGPSLDDYRGDLQMHSVWSDGRQTIDDIATAALGRGYEYCALTDHSHGLRIARGMTMADLQKQHLEIDAVNAKYSGRFRLLKSIEANITADGTIDVPPDELLRLELVVVAAHSGLRLADDQTARMIAAVRTPGVDILGHPRGRMYGARAGVKADWDEVFAVAAQSGVAIEIDGDPARQDLDFAMAERAARAGCLLALDSDAHAPAELRYAETAIAHARLAGVPASRVINCWGLEQLLAWRAERLGAGRGESRPRS